MPTRSPQSVAITAAAPGWTVTVQSPTSGDPITAPIAAWVLAPSAAGPLEAHDLVQPAFLVEGGLWTTDEYTEVFGYSVTVHPPLPAS